MLLSCIVGPVIDTSTLTIGHSSKKAKLVRARHCWTRGAGVTIGQGEQQWCASLGTPPARS